MNRSVLALALLAALPAAHAAPWTYRGTLDDGGAPANGRYDLRLTLLDESAERIVVQPLTLFDVVVAEGRFAVEVDFGADLASAPPLRLKTEVQQGASGFVALGEPTRFDPKAASGGANWDLLGNAGTDPELNFVGTTDAVPLVLRAGNVQAMRLEPSIELVDGTPLTANVIAGSRANAVSEGVRGATVGGGGVPTGNSDPLFDFEGPNRVTDHYGTVAGGYNNQAGTDDPNLIDASFATVGGGARNRATGGASTVGGGQVNTASAGESTVAGGAANWAAGERSTIGGGFANSATATGSTVGGGSLNTAVGVHATVGGGESNLALGLASAVVGGTGNTAVGDYSAVPGGRFNCAGGDGSLAAGTRARVRPGAVDTSDGCLGVPASGDANGDEGTFIWADSQNSSVVSTGADQFVVRAQGGIWFGTTSTPSIPAGRFINTSTGAHLTSGGTWTNASSRTLKTGFSAIDAGAVLDRVLGLPVLRWRYTASPAEGEHLGPIAEDFRAAFGLGADGRSISTVDASGVALAAIQGLNARLQAENDALKARLAAIEAALASRGKR